MRHPPRVARVHACAEPGCPELAAAGRSRCPAHDTPRKAWAHRDGDRARHAREVRAAKRKQGRCTICGTTAKLDAHHLPDGTLVVVCNEHHRMLDPHARKR